VHRNEACELIALRKLPSNVQVVINHDSDGQIAVAEGEREYRGSTDINLSSLPTLASVLFVPADRDWVILYSV
jgi:hypothetical protein